MPIRRVSDAQTEYFLIVFDAEGRERREPDGTLLSDVVNQRLRESPITDVFLTSHGWKGDLPAAIEQYDAWIGAMLKAEADRATARQLRPDFMPLIVGLHWPSLPWGDEEIPTGPGGRVLATRDGVALSLNAEVDAYAARIAETTRARDALRTILSAARNDPSGSLSPAVRKAYETLFAESGLGAGDASGRPGSDQDGFDAVAIIAEARASSPQGRERAAPGVLGLREDLRDIVLSPLRQASFWKMKDRARVFGETGGHELVRRLQQTAPAAHFHLMGHSFGCIVMSAAVAGAPGGTPLRRAVDSLFLVQGALSLWAYASENPYAPGTAGYFHHVVKERLVRGPIVTTRSIKDTAVGRYYPRGAKLKRQLLLVDDKFPKYGGIGAFGIQGIAVAHDLPMQSVQHMYSFSPGQIYNLEASHVIRNGGGASGAHSDIAHPEVAHAFWAAALALPPSPMELGREGPPRDERSAPSSPDPAPSPSQSSASARPSVIDQSPIVVPVPSPVPSPDKPRRTGGTLTIRRTTRRPDLLKESSAVDERPAATPESGATHGRGQGSGQGAGMERSTRPRPAAPSPTAEASPSENGSEAVAVRPPDSAAQRWFNAEVEDHPPDQPLTRGEWYTLAFDVDVVKRDRGVAGTVLDDRGIFTGDVEEAQLTIHLDSDDFEITDPSRTLRLPRVGRSKGKARFDISPRHDGRSALRATIHKEGNFVQQMDLTFTVGGSAPQTVEVTTKGRPPSAAAALQARDAGVTIQPSPGGGYDCLVWGAVACRAHLTITQAYLAKAVDVLRAALIKVVMHQGAGDDVFQTAIDIPKADCDFALQTLARAGARLFQQIFSGPDAGADSKDAGEVLRKLASNPGTRLKIQVVAESAPVPWGLLYLGDAAEGAVLDWDQFLGMRHIVESIPLMNTSDPPDEHISSEPTLAVGLNVNQDIDRQMQGDFVARQRTFWDKAIASRRRLSVAPRSTRAEVLQALKGDAPEQILYFYCHAASAGLDDPEGPDAASLKLTDGEITLGDLSLDAPTRVRLRGSPLVFINACESGDLSPMFYDGFVPYFMAKGARGVVGTECKTPALFAAVWAQRFFERFLDGEPLGEVFLTLRQEFLREHRNPLGLLYAVHCSGDTRIEPALAM